jgi:uncharacterized protein involved in type VI secretion and phage assembly
MPTESRAKAGVTDTVVSATIAGKDHGHRFNRAEIRQGLFAPCEIHVELGVAPADPAKAFDTALSSWLGAKLLLRVKDRLDNSIEKTYEGIITSVNLTTDVLQIEARSEDHLLTVARRHRSFAECPASDIVNQIVKPSVANHELKAPEKSVRFRFFHQYEETDHDVLRRLARYDGCVFYHDGEKFRYGPKLGGLKNVTLNLEHVANVMARCSLALNKWSGVPYDPAHHNEPSQNRVQSGSYSPPGHPFSSKVYQRSQANYKERIEEIYNESLVNKEEFDRFVKNQQSLSAGKMVRVEGETNHPLVAIGRTIKCEGHPILAHPVVVTDLVARFEGNIYRARFGAAAEDAVILPEEPDRRHHLGLLQPASVVDNKDKEKLGRVQVRYLWDVEGKTFAWARVLQAGAGQSAKGKRYGTHYTPRVGDQVLVGCENGDPSLPIVLGALYHSEGKPDFVTENGTEEVLVVRTPNESTIRVLDKSGEEEIVVSMRDSKNLIRLELKQPKITVESVGGTIAVHAKNIEVRADEKLSFTGKDVEITARQNMTVSVTKDKTVTVGGKSAETVTGNKEIAAGGNLTAKATTTVDIQGGTSVNLKGTTIDSSAAAQNSIKGAIVQIN